MASLARVYPLVLALAAALSSMPADVHAINKNKPPHLRHENRNLGKSEKDASSKSAKAAATYAATSASKSGKSGIPLGRPFAKSGKSGALFANAGMNLAYELASNLNVKFRMGENFDNGADCSLADWQLCYTATIVLEYTGDEDYTNDQFKIYFSNIHRLLQVNHDDFTHEHVTGDLTHITPTSSFGGFGAHQSVELPIVKEYWSVQETDVMPRWFVVDDRDGSTAMIQNTNTEDMRSFVEPYESTLKTSSDNNIPMTASSRYELNQELVTEDTDARDRIIPTPYRVEVADDAETFNIKGISLTGGNLLGDTVNGVADLLGKLSLTDDVDYLVQLELGALPLDIVGTESYVLNITSDGSVITASDRKGLFYGIMSLVGLLDVGGDMSLKEMVISDKPRFDYRGHQVDSARNFRSKATIMSTIDAMSLWKLNTLHLAMTNDEGWRLEIPGLEELTDIGAKRCFDPSEETCLLTQLGSGPNAHYHSYYTRQDYIDILKYAAERNVKVLPEFNMPAHARAAVISMEARAKKGDDNYRLMDPEDKTELLTIQFYNRASIINPCLDSSVNFVRKLVSEVKQMHDEAGVPLHQYHFGGDEAKNILFGAGFSSIPDLDPQLPFSKSPACQKKAQEDPSFDIEHIANYWAVQVNKILAQYGVREMFAWEDGIRGTSAGQFETENVVVDFWETLFWGGISGLVEIVSHGFEVIMANPDYLYFDFPYEVNTEERGYYWAARFNSVYKVFTFAPENLAQNAETSTDRDGNVMSVTTPDSVAPKIRGMQGQTWSETIRTDEQYFEMAFPRILSVAERAWHKAEWELDWQAGVTYDDTTNNVDKDALLQDYGEFVTALGCKEVKKLEKIGISYRVPPPGAIIDSGTLSANSELPCTTIMFSIDGGSTWQEYTDSVNVGDGVVVVVKSASPNDTLMSREVPVE